VSEGALSLVLPLTTSELTTQIYVNCFVAKRVNA